MQCEVSPLAGILVVATLHPIAPYDRGGTYQPGFCERYYGSLKTVGELIITAPVM